MFHVKHFGKFQAKSLTRPETADSLKTCKIGAIGCPIAFRPKPESAIHFTAGIIGEAASVLSRTRALLAPAQPVLRILDRADPLAKLAAMR